MCTRDWETTGGIQPSGDDSLTVVDRITRIPLPIDRRRGKAAARCVCVCAAPESRAWCVVSLLLCVPVVPLLSLSSSPLPPLQSRRAAGADEQEAQRRALTLALGSLFCLAQIPLAAPRMSALPALPKLDPSRYAPFASPPPRHAHTPHSATAASAQQRTQRGQQQQQQQQGYGFTTPAAAAAAASSFATAAAASSARPAAAAAFSASRPTAAPAASAARSAAPASAAPGRSQLRCQSCDSTDLEENALGYWICVDCGAQSFERQALTQEVDEGMFQNMGQLWRTGTRIRKLRPVARKISKQEQEIIASQVVLHGMGGLLQLQVRALILSFGLPPALADVVGRLWIHYLEWWPIESSRRGGRNSSGGSAEGNPDGHAQSDPPVIWGATHREMIVRRYVPGLIKGQRTEQVEAMNQRRRNTLAKNKGIKLEPDTAATAAAAAQQQDPAAAVFDDGHLYDDDEPAVKVKPDRKRRFDEGEDEGDDGQADGDDEREDDAQPQPSPELAELTPVAEHADDAVMRDAHGAADHPSPSPEEDAPAGAAARVSTTNSSRNQILLEPGELSLSLSLALLYLGCHLLREPLTMQHLALWVHLGRIPYFSPKGLPSALAERIAASPKLTTFFHPSAVPSASKLMALAHTTAGRIAEVMQVQAHAAANQAAAVGASMEGAQFLLEQSAQLRTWLASSASPESLSFVDPALSSSTSNTSLLLRTWLSQLSFPPALHGVVMELVSMLQLSTDKIVAGRVNASATAGAQSTRTGEAQNPVKGNLRTTTHQQTMLMACLVLALQLTYGAKPAPKPSEEQDSSLAIDPKTAPHTKGLDPALVRRAQEAAGASGLKRQSSDESVSDSERGPSRSPSAARPSSSSVSVAGAAPSPPSSLSSNWRTSSFRLPRTVHESRTLSAANQTPFVEWVSSVVLSRMQPLKEFEFYTEMLEQIANTKETIPAAAEETPEADEEEEQAEDGEEESEGGQDRHRQPKQNRMPDAAVASSAPVVAAASASSAPSSLLSALSCSEVLSYTTNRSGYYHAAYSSLLQRCAHLIGIRVAPLHQAVQSIIRMARDTKQVEQPRSKQRRV